MKARFFFVRSATRPDRLNKFLASVKVTQVLQSSAAHTNFNLASAVIPNPLDMLTQITVLYEPKE
ncbi:MAG: hypothetical protein A3J07_01055 [Candidatus Doudnabacteria bacterium RIFCSPLOWO2_02_FULL_49_13]|uniref:Uncharacterized protein n=1 Tax=Candidatus Doudnabacteria bacterium RIFCSPHIGHO2_12_FULL_48_16 TaxID=1817838 RepID=A0A1F5PKY4_9BACT|nr:MAG: hypothetical protein A3B77_03985 [Candidatus Doudnabacteria bacterium RIFCSPHIGHO2_02_FULL_49_24]OGE88647.1 MAG: hypothetical protein A2760_01645 [Candidatus Doudnabacteria bacterium RIFCSPHIGHO2_01_FULL_50_67]OGE90332.1 MAG: hypothetical protein A3E29_04565 [Candidatus Doudnabacteria bacterium RIFCSPHIGHO2_12_FULL_48_16]OGE97039.1 MAG: hypothetical protein A2990_01555 [Candidatus Doudnabacteria bacterium RIFCSPLOWO2_01_FULL_49_40]OGF02388.1 MAG: hypothetical protein A3J07_01055 [Candid